MIGSGKGFRLGLMTRRTGVSTDKGRRDPFRFGRPIIREHASGDENTKDGHRNQNATARDRTGPLKVAVGRISVLFEIVVGQSVMRKVGSGRWASAADQL